jgi:hypothetical protein
MKINYLLITILLMCFCNSAKAQNFTFASDANGNRTGRTMTLLKSSIGTSTDTTQSQMKNISFDDQIGEVSVTLFQTQQRE